jgi:hypothetical protein
MNTKYRWPLLHDLSARTATAGTMVLTVNATGNSVDAPVRVLLLSVSLGEKAVLPLLRPTRAAVSFVVQPIVNSWQRYLGRRGKVPNQVLDFRFGKQFQLTGRHHRKR